MAEQETGDAPRIRTMEEFSAAAGISRPTLSRFFNDPQSVRKASRIKIEEAMERLGYRPNRFALNFNRRNPKTLGIIVPSLIDPFYASLIQRIERQALSSGYWSVVQNSQGEPEQEAEAIATSAAIAASPGTNRGGPTPTALIVTTWTRVFPKASPTSANSKSASSR